MTAAPAAPRPAKRGSLHVIGDSGTPVDWWFIYKVAKGSQTSGPAATGQEYLYFDSEMNRTPGTQPVLSRNRIDRNGALRDTLGQLFTPAAKANKDLGWYCYNDEDHLQKNRKTGDLGGAGPGNRGHCKGALAFDLASDTALWLIHSVPLLPMNAAFVYRPGELEKAQTLLCIQLAGCDTAKHIAQLMFDAHGPNVLVASDMLTTAHDPANNIAKPPITNVPVTLGNTDPRVRLMQNENGSTGPDAKPYADRVPFYSAGKEKFTAIAKNRIWGDPTLDPAVKTRGAMDFYNDLVSSVLDEALAVETWEDAKGKIPPPLENGEKHPVENTASINLAPLHFPYAWPEAVDHAKLAISDRSNPPHLDRYVCVGDINFTDAQDQRGGGTCAFVCPNLWSAIASVLVEGTPPGEGGGAKASPKETASKTAANARVGTTKAGARKSVRSPAKAVLAAILFS